MTKTEVLDVRKSASPKEVIKRIVARNLNAYYDVHILEAGIEYDSVADIWYFEMSGTEKSGEFNRHTYNGFVGCLGQIEVTGIDGETFDIRHFQEVLG